MTKALFATALLLSGCFLPNERVPMGRDVFRAPVTYPLWKHSSSAYISPCNLASTDAPWAYHWFPFDTCMACVTAQELGTVPTDNAGRSIEGTCWFALGNDFTERKTDKAPLGKALRGVILDEDQ